MTATVSPATRHDRRPEQARDELLARAADTAPALADLIGLYYRHVPAEEMQHDQAADLVGAVRSHRELAAVRAPGRPAIRVVNPTRGEDGWACRATVVQVVTDDMPYLVDSVSAELARSGVTVHRVVHPIVVVRRSITGELQDVLIDADPAHVPGDAIAESWMHLEVSRVTDGDMARQVEQRLVTVINDVREVVEDSAKMIDTARGIADRLDERTPSGITDDAARDGAAFLRWLADGNFTFLGYRDYELITDDDEHGLRAVLASGLGVLRRDSLAARSFTSGPGGSGLGGMEAALSKELLVLTQASAPSSVVRPVHPYYVGVKTFDEHGDVRGEHRFLGMLTSTALHENVLDIPVIRRRVLGVIQRAGFPLDSHSGQRMLDVIQNYPRAELFSTDANTLYTTVTGVLSLAERRTLRLFLRRDPYQRFYSCLVYLPRDRWTTTVRLRMQDTLVRELDGRQIEYNARVGESPLARVHFMVHTDPNAPEREFDVTAIQDLLSQAMRTWDDRLADVVTSAPGAGAADADGEAGDEVDRVTALVERYLGGLPEAYKEAYNGAEALADLRRLEALGTQDGADAVDMAFYSPADAAAGELRFKLYVTREVTLSQVLPVLQAMGVEVIDERPYHLTRADGVRFFVYDFGLRVDPGVLAAVPEDAREEFGRNFQEAFAAAWQGAAEVDRFNALVMRARLTWRQASVLRAYTKYLRQAGTLYSQDYIEDVVLAHTGIAAALVALFEARFDPDAAATDDERAAAVERLTGEITRLVDEVTSLDADRILRGFLTLMTATLRTTHYVPDAGVLAFKLDPQQIPDLPKPRPTFEIFVYSPRVEGVHLRFGPVARGGLRWSDRREDFRTEVLGLVKAQAVKNAVIVPVGAKGGFVVKRPPAPTGDPGRDREATMTEGIACYRLFIGALLDLTDNLRAGAIVPAAHVVRHDGDDAYLVVAADKGTATFSDIANEVAVSRGFWLGDAFASGGSAGYDHKGMGITARGAWESVKRHFRELGVDTQSDDFTVVGIGDMSGDVFGNGMLLSEHIRLVAAFDHRHVFLDPDPDASTSYRERQRMFALPRSSWDDYDRSLISEGGGVHPRSAKSIPVSPQVRAVLGLPDGVEKLSPPELLRAIVLAPVDLLWNGGIGTYVKAAAETNAEVGDKANDAIRVDGAELRVKVIGEGGNLGFTQRGRIEFARIGGKVNTDAIDNSAGVDCSDHEVNIKILLDRLVVDGVLPAEQRNPLLAEMTDEVASLVLRDNHSQNEMLGVARAHAPGMLSVHSRLVDHLGATRGLDRKLEALPTRQQFAALEQAADGLTSPELATLLAHVKLALKADVLASELPDAEVFAAALPGYFPTPLRDRYRDAIAAHPLHREIITTVVVNEVVDGAGITFAFRLGEELSAGPTDAVRAFAVVNGVFDLQGVWRRIRDLDNVVATDVQDHLMLETRRLLDRSARWLLSNRPQPLQVGPEIARFAPIVAELAPRMPELLRGREAAGVARDAEAFVDRGVPVELARTVAAMLFTYGLLDVAEVAARASRGAGGTRTPLEAAQLYYALSEHLEMDRMLTSVTALERGNRWHSLARLSLRDEFYGALRAITLDVLRSAAPGTTADERIEAWSRANASRIARARVTLTDIAEAGQYDLATLSVAARLISSMGESR